MARGPMDLWNQWAPQILVLLSLTLQVVLHMFAGVRRREASPVERFILWLAYQLADSTAIYAVGHLSLSSAARNHKLVAFWAPFLLLHLGGPDSITAYSLEDNKLWKRHLVTLVVQVLGAGYVLYKNIAGNGVQITVAAILMSVVGTAKYGERTLALWSANFSTIRNILRIVPRDKHQHFYIESELPRQPGGDEFLLQRAHSLLHVCSRGMVDSVMFNESDDADDSDATAIRDLLEKEKDHSSMWMVMEMELSLMYDILYTKAFVIHTSHGYSIRVVAPIAVVASLLLFHFGGNGSNSGVDVAITYVLLAGALVLETRSLLTSLGSSWALVFLCTTRWSWLRHVGLCGGRWHRFRRAVLSLRRPARVVMPTSSRRWSGRIGQYNVLHSCYHDVTTMGTSRHSFKLLKDLSILVGLTDWKDMKHCSWNITVPGMVKTSLKEMHHRFKPYDLNTMGLLRHTWGKLAMSKKWGNKARHDLYKKMEDYRGLDFHESILIWHIATDLVLTEKEQDGPKVEAIRAMSNYMMFLFVNCPDMLPGLPQNWLYQKTKINIVEACKKSIGVTKELQHVGQKSSWIEQSKHLARILLISSHGEEAVKPGPKVPRLTYAQNVARDLSKWDKEDPVDVLFDLWIDFLMYAANRCNRESHAKKLNKGGEFLTIVWLMIEHSQQLAKAIKE
ncbi:uncharacterized protein LOC102713074 [Oryza brachyantha]|uniref:DUF4220 domain-containing protein n=1 Tax=Oryza brachyantha TaxID=4533 RepID=J3LVJ4_ORYBR|nr:uncharacterized protein LOC102713074 [Oryza brachyantha]AHW98502.1 hypothetical protein [Oryza brachyantha]